MARISLLCADLERNPLYTPWMFAGALGRDHDVELIGPEPARLWPPAAGELVPAHLLPGSNPIRPEMRRRAADATAKADLLYAFKPHPASLGVGLWLRWQRVVPLAVHVCDWDSGYFADQPRMRRVWYSARGMNSASNELYVRTLEHFVPRADLVTVSTRALQKRFGGVLIRQGVDGARFSPERFPREEARARIGVDAQMPLVVFVGTPSLHKGLEDLITAFHQLPDDVRGQLIIVGTPPDNESARMLAENRGRGVECSPYVPFGAASWYVAAADVVCAPQRRTSFTEHQLPGKVLHWMALGACILTTDVGDAREILCGQPPAGRVVPASDPRALQDALAELLRDDSQRRLLGTEARARAERLYTWEPMSGDLSRAFASIGVDG